MSPCKTPHTLRLACLAVLLAVSLAACKRESPSGEPADAPATPAASAPDASTAPVALKDVIETTDHYVVGISYPASVNRYPGLAKALADYSATERAELMEAVEAFGNDKPSAPYELSLAFEQVVDTPQIVAVAADGSRYTGGAHGQPLIARFVWLPQHDQRLTSAALVTGPKGWQAISDYVREHLHTAVVTRADEDELAAVDRAALIKSTSRMIDEGTEPEPGNFSEFVPVLDASGHITALRFVFPPYQVGPYADGTQTVDVPSVVLLPHVAPEYAGLFAR
ncbi:MAG TPA: DUF3298 and DUF4163 domain-containing protein [Pseudoxanthomonas sp.]